LLTALAIVAAVMEESDRICICENGVMSINLPISTQVIGARASRSTHPRSVMLLSQLARFVGGDQIVIDNPFIWQTKAEVVRELCAREEATLIRGTFSCSNTRGMSAMAPHCGKCAQCLQRRIAILAAGAADTDPGEGYAVDLLIGPRDRDEDLTMAIDMVRSAFEHRRMSNTEFGVRFANELAWVTSSFPGMAPADVARRVIAMAKRQGDAVRDVFVHAATENAAALIEGALPGNCLLRAVFPTADMALDNAPIVSPRPGEVHSGGEAEEGGATALAELVITIDADKKWVLIEDFAPIAGRKSFPLIAALIEVYCKDRDQGRRPENYRTMSASELADRIEPSDEEGVRKTIARIRADLAEGCVALGRPTLAPNQLIQTIHGKGYRINPTTVRVVALGEIRRG
jgi:hypothetical protein